MTSRANPEHWTRLLTLIGREDLIGDARYATPADRVAREPEVDALIADWTRRHTKHEAMALVGGVGVPAGAVLDTMELQNDPASRRAVSCRPCSTRMQAPFTMPAWPVRVDGTPPRVAPSPGLGEHTEAVLRDWLSLSLDAIAALRAEGAL